MTWLLMWLNVSVATLNATLQLLVLYRLVVGFDISNTNTKIKTIYGNMKEDCFLHSLVSYKRITLLF